MSDPGAQTSVRGSIVTFSPLASDLDSDALTWSATGIPAGLSIQATTGLISGTVSTSAATAYGVNLTVTDPGGLSATRSFV